MPTARLSRTAVEKLPQTDKQTIYWDTRLTGFGVRINPDSRSWLVAFRVKGKEYRRSLGRCDRVDIDVAYRQAETIIKDAAQDISPEDRARDAEQLRHQEQQAAALDTTRAITLQQIFDEYLVTRKKLKQSSRDLYKEELDRYCPEWLTLPIRAITPDMILVKHATIGATAPSRADSLMRIIRALMNHAVTMYDETVITRNPVRKLSQVGGWYRLPRRTGHLSAGELGPWVNVVMQLPSNNSRDALLMLLYTGARLKEILTLQWDRVDLEEATIYFHETKTGPLLIPVCGHIQELLKMRHERAEKPETGYVFPSYGTSGHAEDLRASLRLVKSQCGKLITPHDLRRTFLTICEEMDVGPFTQKRLVGHALPEDVTQGYVQISMRKMRAVVEDVAEYIADSVSKKSVTDGN